MEDKKEVMWWEGGAMVSLGGGDTGKSVGRKRINEGCGEEEEK